MDILNDIKEMAEHTMVVDLLRNDLGIIANNVRVDKFRYVEKINAGDKKLLQVSSQISANLQNDWNKKIGDIPVPSGKVLRFVSKRGEIGVHTAYADAGYDLSKLNKGVFSSGKVGYKNENLMDKGG